MLTRAFLVSLLLALTACASPPVSEPNFTPGPGGDALPWTHERFDDESDKFTFALFSDLTGGEREGIYDVAVAQLNLLRPEFIVSVGDLIEGGTADRNRLAAEWDSFDRRAGRAHAPVFYAGGNHDLTNPVMWDVWDERYGERYYHFVYKDVLFLVLDTEDNPPEVQLELARIRDEALQVVANEGWGAFGDTRYGRDPLRKTGRVGAEQANFFAGVIADNAGVRWTFVLMHKPAWQAAGEVNFSRIEAALADRPYTVFYGHEHSYLYQERLGRDYIRLATTGGVQNAKKDMAIDHVTLVTVSQSGVDIANLRLSGIFDRSGQIPAGGESLCFDVRVCGPGL